MFVPGSVGSAGDFEGSPSPPFVQEPDPAVRGRLAQLGVTTEIGVLAAGAGRDVSEVRRVENFALVGSERRTERVLVVLDEGDHVVEGRKRI